MKRLWPFLTIMACLFIYQNCGEFSALRDEGDQSSLVVPVEQLDIRSLELKRYAFNQDIYYQSVRIEITDSSMFLVLDESGVCQRSALLGPTEQVEIFDLFKKLSYRQKGGAAATDNQLVAELVVENLEGDLKNSHVVLNKGEENSLPANAEILEQSTALVNLINEIIDKEYTTDQSACQSTEVIPRFVEYVWTQAQGQTSTVTEAFIFDSQNNGNTVFVSLPDQNTCYQAYLLNLDEQAMVIRALVQTAARTQTGAPANSSGIRFMDYYYVDQQSIKYYLDNTAPANAQILENGEAMTDTVLAIMDMVQARYQAEGESPTSIDRCIIE